MKKPLLLESLRRRRLALVSAALLSWGTGHLIAQPTVSVSGLHIFGTVDNVHDGSVTPLSATTIADADGSPVTVFISISPTGFGTLGSQSSLYTSGLLSAASATTLIQSLIFDPLENQVFIGSTTQITFSVWAQDTNLVFSATNSVTKVTITPFDDPPTITGVTSTNTTDAISVTPFSSFSIGDVDNRGTQSLSVTINQDDSHKGTIVAGASGFVTNSGTYTMTGTPANVTTAIRQLVYVPTKDRLPVGTNDVTTFTTDVSDGAHHVPAINTVTALSTNDSPTITGVSSAHQLLASGQTIQPFAASPGTVINDPDVGDDTNRLGQLITLQVTVTGDAGNGQLIAPGEGFVAAGKTYTLGGVTHLEATTAIQGLTYQAQTTSLLGTNSVGFTLTVTDDHGASATNSSAVVDVYSPYTTPAISGTRAAQRVNDNTTLALFSGVNLQSFNGGSFIVMIRLDDDAKGELVNLTAFTKSTASTPATYIYSGTSEGASTAIRQILFRPTNNRINGSLTETTTNIITLVDGGITNAPNTTTTVIVTPVNDAPQILSISAPPAPISDTTSIAPFPFVRILDVDESGVQPLTVSVRLDDMAKGSFSTASLITSGFSSNSGTYTFVGTPTNSYLAIRKLVFVPTPNRLPLGASDNTFFLITADDGHGGVTVNGATYITVAALVGGPVFSVPPSQPVSLPITPPLTPLSLVGLSGPGDMTLTLQLSNSTWGAFSISSLVANGFTTNTPGTNVLIGNAATLANALGTLEFLPSPTLPLNTSIFFNLSATDQTGNAAAATLAITLRQAQKTLIVTKTIDVDPSASNSGGTLRRAIQEAGNNDHITFDLRPPGPGLPAYPATIQLNSPLIISKNLTIDGPGANLLTLSGAINGSPGVQLFQVNAQLTVHGLALCKGHASFAGGAIEINPSGKLVLSYSAITGCVADIWGGAIDVNGGSLDIDHCLFRANSTSASIGQGGGAISFYTDQECSILNTTFAGNQQLSPGGLGGGALYVEDFNPGQEFDLFILSSTFSGNNDAAGKASSIRPNVFNTAIQLQNDLFADGQGENLEVDQSGLIFSLGGNISDDGTRSVFSVGGAPVDTTVLSQPSDFTNTLPTLLAVTNNGGPTWTVALGPTNAVGNAASAALNNAVSNPPSATGFDTLATDQRGFWRADGSNDIGAFERSATQRIIIEEILFNPAGPNINDEFIEFYVPRDSTALNLLGFQVFVRDQLRHTFTSQVLNPGEAFVLFSHSAVNTTAGSVHKGTSDTDLHLDDTADTIKLKNPWGETVLEVSYVGSYASSDPTETNFIANANQSIVLNPQFQGWYLPFQTVANNVGGTTNLTADPGYDATGIPLVAGNAPPIAYSDSAATDTQTLLPALDVLANDVDPDAGDTLRVVGVGVTNSLTPGVSTTSGLSVRGAAVSINNSPQTGATVRYDPTASTFLRSLPQGSNVVDTFQYTILDYSNGVAHTRGTDSSNNIVKATATVSVSVTGVNLAPTPRDDGVTNSPNLTTSEDTLLDFTTASSLLRNDTDPNSDDNSNTLAIVSVQNTGFYSNSLQTLSALGAWVTLDIRFDRTQTHITYDPRGSTTLNSLQPGQTTLDTFYYSVRDSHGAIGTAAVRITVTGANDKPTANPDSFATYEDTVLTIPTTTLVGNDTDPDTGIPSVTDTLTVSAVSNPSTLGASVQIVGGNVIYDPRNSATLNALARKEVVVDTFTYTVIDPNGATSNAVVSVTVTGVNDTPLAVGDAYTTGEKTPVSISAPGVMSNDRDPDVNGVPPDDTLRVIPFVQTNLSGATVTMNANGSFLFDPRGAFAYLGQGEQTNDVFSYTVMDHSFTIANDDLFSVRGDSASNVLPVLANDALLSQVGASLSIIGVGTPNQSGTVSVNTQATALIYTPAPSFVGVETFSYTISDGIGGTDTATVSVTVTVDPLNGNLAANPDSFTVAKGTSVSFDVLANDNILPAPGAALSIVAVSTPNQGGTAALNGAGPHNLINYTPNPAHAAPYTETFTYQVSGGGIAQATGTVTVRVIDRSNTLVADDDTFTVIAGGSTTSLDVLANDQILPGPNSNLSIISIVTNGIIGAAAINAAGDRLLYTPPSDTNVTSHVEPFISYTISDGAGGTATASVSIQVLATGFIANNDVFSVVKNSTGNALAVLANDVILPNNGQSLFVTDTGLGANAPNHGGSVTVAPGGTGLIYTPSTNFVGDEIFTYEISDGTVTRAQGQVRVTVVDTSTNISNPDSFNVAANSLNNVLPVLANDYGLPLTLTTLSITGFQTNGLRGTVASVGSAVSYTPAAGFIGADTFKYETVDAFGDRGTNTVTVTVGGLITRDDQFSVLSGSSSNLLDLLANDPLLPDTTSVRPIVSFSTPDHGGTVKTNAGGTMALYTPAAAFIGFEHFTYAVKNDSGSSIGGNVTVSVLKAGSDRVTTNVTITLIGTNDPPIITGTQGGWAITDKQTVQPFTNVTISDLDAHGLQPLLITVSLDNSIKGVVTNLGGFINSAPGVYTFNGIGANASTAIRGLFFVPTQNRITVPTSEVTTLSIAASDSLITVIDRVTTITVTASNDPPVVSGTLANQRVYDHLSMLPFAGTTITEVDDLGLQPLSVQVTLAQPIQGFLAGLGPFVAMGSGVYSITNVTGAQATTALRALLYVPTPNGRLLPGASETNQLSIAVNDRFAPTVTDTKTTVISSDSFVRKTATLDGTTKDLFNYSVSANRDLVAVGTPSDTNTVSVKTGSASLLSRTNSGPESWNSIKRVIGSDSVAGDQFGFSVGLSGDTLVVGAPTATQGGKSTGVAYVFTNAYVNALQAIKLIPSDGANLDQFGQSVAINGDTIVVGADLNSGTGAAYVYGRNQGGANKWGLIKKLTPTDGASSDLYGISVAINLDTIAIGSQANSPQNNNNRAGSIYAYDRNQGGANNWGLTKKMSAVDGLSNDGLGHSVAVSGNLIVAGAPYVTINNSKSGRIYVFDRNLGGSNNWGQTNEFLPFDGAVGSQFGISVTLDGELFAAGTLLDVPQGGATYVYARSWPGLTNWSPLEKLVPSTNDTYAAFGWAVSLSQNTLAVGAHTDNPANNSRQADTYVYRLKYNNGPAAALSIPNQVAVTGTPFTFAVAAGTFTDDDVSDTLTLSLVPLPAGLGWLSFNPTTGTFTGTPTNTTTTTFAVGVRATDQDGASVTNTFNLKVQTGALAAINQEVQSPLALWRSTYFPGESMDPALEDTFWGNNADPDGDGASNLQEYVFGGNPLSADPGDSKPLAILPSGNPGTFLLTFKQRFDDPNLVYSVQEATGSAGWQSLKDADFLAQSVVVIAPGVAQVTYEIRAGNVPSEPHLLRLNVTFLAPE